jgi:hypothetical protein
MSVPRNMSAMRFMSASRRMVPAGLCGVLIMSMRVRRRDGRLHRIRIELHVAAQAHMHRLPPKSSTVGE